MPAVKAGQNVMERSLCLMGCREWCTSHRLLDGRFHVGGPNHHVAGSIQDDALPRPLVQEQHLALTRHHILAAYHSITCW